MRHNPIADISVRRVSALLLAAMMFAAAGCGAHNAAPAGAPLEAAVPAAVPAMQPYTVATQLPPAPPVVQRVHRTLRLCEYQGQPCLQDETGRRYYVARDRNGRFYPCWRNPSSGRLLPVYYDGARDRYYDVAWDGDDNCFVRHYVDDSDSGQYYPNQGGYEYAYGSSAPPDYAQPVIVCPNYISYSDYQGEDTVSYYHQHRDQWWLAVPLVVTAYLVLQPHHHHAWGYQGYAPPALAMQAAYLPPTQTNVFVTTVNNTSVYVYGSNPQPRAGWPGGQHPTAPLRPVAPVAWQPARAAPGQFANGAGSNGFANRAGGSPGGPALPPQASSTPAGPAHPQQASTPPPANHGNASGVHVAANQPGHGHKHPAMSTAAGSHRLAPAAVAAGAGLAVAHHERRMAESPAQSRLSSYPIQEQHPHHHIAKVARAPRSQPFSPPARTRTAFQPRERAQHPPAFVPKPPAHAYMHKVLATSRPERTLEPARPNRPPARAPERMRAAPPSPPREPPAPRPTSFEPRRSPPPMRPRPPSGPAPARSHENKKRDDHRPA
ncbi:MAG: hypothetical protein ACLQVD_03040 [Capsulimonadaceae bacterium]